MIKQTPKALVFLTAKEAADYLGISRATFYRLNKFDPAPYYQFTAETRKLYAPSQLRSWYLKR